MLDIKYKYKKKYSSKNGSENDSFLCNICKSHEDNAENILQCTPLGNTSDIQFNDLFSNNIDKVSKAIKQFKKLWKIRENKLQ